MQERPLVSIIIVTLNTPQMTQACLQSVLKNTTVPYELIVVNNSRAKGIQDCLKGLRDIRVLENSRNLGYARAANRGALESRGEYRCFLNTDTLVPPGWLERLLEGFCSPGVGAVSPITSRMGYRYDWPPAGLCVNEATTALVDLAVQQWHRHGFKEVRYLLGFCAVIPRAVMARVGFFDERFFYGYDDLDYSFRLRLAGYRILRMRSVFVHHQGAGSVKAPRRERLLREARQAFMMKWKSHPGIAVPEYKHPSTRRRLLFANWREFFDPMERRLRQCLLTRKQSLARREMTCAQRPAHLLYLLSGGGLGGMATAVVELARSVDALRYRVTVALLTQEPAAGLFREHRLAHIVLPKRNRQEFLRNLIRHEGIRLVQSCDAASDAALAAFQEGIPHVWLIGGGVETTCAGRSPQALQAFRALIGRLSHAVVVPTRALAREEFPRLPAQRLRVIPWGIELHPFAPCHPTGWLRRRLGIPPQAPLVAMIGNFYSTKRHLDFIDAAKRIHEVLSHARFVIAGRCVGGLLPWAYRKSVRYRAQIAQAIRNRRLEGIVRFTRFSHGERAAWLGEMALLLYPSHEGLSLAMLEAMSCAIPVVAVDAGGNAEAIEDGISGRLVPDRDPEAMARAALEILENRHLAQQLGHAARRKVRTVFTPARQASSFEQLYEELLTKEPAPHTA